MGEDRLNHPEASNSNYWGNNKGNLTNILNEFENEPEMEEILVCGKVVISKKYVDVETNMIITLRIIKYKNSFYFTEFDNKGYLSFKKIR